jgi:hypothetical protein
MSLVLYGSSVADSTLTTACDMSSAVGGTETSKATTIVSTALTYAEIYSQGGASPPAASIPAPTGHGWVYNPGAGTFSTGNWSASITLSSVCCAPTNTTVRFYRLSSGVYTAIGSIVHTGGAAAKTTYAYAATSMGTITFAGGDLLYTDLWWHDASSNVGGDNPSVYVTTSATQGKTSDMQILTPAFTSTSAILATSPTTLSFAAVQGLGNPAAQNSTLSETGGVATAWTSSISYGSGSGWLAISPTSGSLTALGNHAISFTCTTGALAAGTYTATATFTATTGGATATVAVTFVVSAPASPTLSTSPASLTFSDILGGSGPASKNSTLSETGGTGSAWTSAISYITGSGWLGIAPTSGTLTALGTQVVAFTCTTGALTAGNYFATVTYTATTGGSQATVNVTFTVNPTPPPPPSPNTILLANQDITLYCDQATVVVDDTLGQGGGAGSSGGTQGRAATIKFNTHLGPMANAIGAGQTIPSGPPSLVRQGEIVITDSQGSIVFGGFATKYTDTTTSVLGQTVQSFTTVEGIDYSTSLQRTLVNETFTAQTDIQIISFVMKKYAPWIKLDFLPTNPAYLFPLNNFRNVTLEVVLQTIAGITGYMVFVDYHKFLRYLPPTLASSAPFSLSYSPDFVHTFPHNVQEFLVDDNSAINRVLFFGGTRLSNNFWQDMSPMVNGNNKIFTLAYNPLVMADGHYHVQLGGSNGVGGTEQIVGTSNSSGVSNQLISAGGTAQCLIDQNGRSITFDTAPSGTTLYAGYRFSFPLSIILTDEVSHAFFGNPYLDGFISDTTIFDTTTAVQRCRVLLAQQSMGLTSLKVDTWFPGIQAGMLLAVVNPLRGINASYLVQQVQIETYGGGNYVYHISLGAWNWNLIDWLLKLPTLAAFQDSQANETTDTVTIQSIAANVGVNDLWQYPARTSTGPYYARAYAAGLSLLYSVPRMLGSTIEGVNFDGHAAFCGFATVAT